MDAHDKKHPCSDCSFCQWCSDDRCTLCLKQNCPQGRKRSLQEQIELFDRLNTRQASENGNQDEEQS